MMTGRDGKGRFVSGRKVEQPRNASGRFVPKSINTISDNIIVGKTEVSKVFARKEGSRAAVIEAALVKGASNINEIVEVVVAVKPDDPKRVKGQVSAILRDIRNEKGGWKKYEIIDTETEIRIQVKADFVEAAATTA